MSFLKFYISAPVDPERGKGNIQLQVDCAAVTLVSLSQPQQDRVASPAWSLVGTSSIFVSKVSHNININNQSVLKLYSSRHATCTEISPESISTN